MQSNRGLLLILLLSMGCERERGLALVELVSAAAKNEHGGAVATFRQAGEWTGEIRLGERTEESITPPFPSALSFDLELPEHALLDLSVGVETERLVRRARVLFQIDLEVEGRTVEVYRRGVLAREANAFHDARVDLGAWGGKPVRLTLRTEPLQGPGPVPWADRILTVWGNPVIRSREPRPLAASERPSFIFILADTLRADFLGAYGFEGSISPAIDRLALESVQFENGFANAPWTKPAVATLFTSLHPLVHGVTNMGRRGWEGEAARLEALSGDAVTLAESLREAGYQTAAFIANPHISPRYGFSQGFEVFEWREKTGGLLESARAWLREQSETPETPFFLYLHLMDVHGPYDAPRADFEAVLEEIGPRISKKLTKAEYEHIPPYLRDTEWLDEEEPLRVSSWHAKYGAGVRVLDRNLRPFLDELRLRGTLDRTYLVFTADHGEELMEHGGWNHGENLYEHQLHVPLLVRKPLAEDAGRRVTSLVSLLDLMPTLLSLAEVEPPPDVEGRDLSALLRNEESGERSPVYLGGVNERPELHGIRTTRRKLIWNSATGDTTLYDLIEDPRERRDRSAEENETLALLKAALDEHLEDAEEKGSLSSETAPLDDETRERLKALGYVP